MVQFLPTSPERQRQADLDPGDAPEGIRRTTCSRRRRTMPGSRRSALVETVEDHELIDPTVVERAAALPAVPRARRARLRARSRVHEDCRCSRERIMGMLRRFSAEDRRDMVGDDGRIGVTCEFCSRFYDLDPAEVEAEIAKSD